MSNRSRPRRLQGHMNQEKGAKGAEAGLEKRRISRGASASRNLERCRDNQWMDGGQEGFRNSRAGTGSEHTEKRATTRLHEIERVVAG